MHIAVRGPAHVRHAPVSAPTQQPVALFCSSLDAWGDNAMDATPTLMWSPQHLVSEGLSVLAVPRDRQSITANAYFHADATPEDDISQPDATRSAWVVR
jgi:hypothetical protein